MLLLVALLPLGFGLAGSNQITPAIAAPPWHELPRERAERVVFLAGDLAEEDLIAFTANLAASGHPGVLLLDTPRFGPYVKTFLTSFQPEHVIPVGPFADDT